MRPGAILVFLLVCTSFLVCQQTSTAPAPASVSIKIRAALFDRDLNLKPVPRLAITLKPKTAGASITAQTTLDGVAEIEVAPGTYQLSTDKPAELFGKQYLWDMEISVTKPAQVIELSNDNAKVNDAAAARGAHVDELAEQFKRVRGAVATVWTEDAAGDGFLVDKGLILTSHPLIDGHKWIAVQFDGDRRLQAELVYDDAQKSIAFLRVSTEPIKDLPVPSLSLDPDALIEGERVFTIDNTTKHGKIMSTGVVSRASKTEIVSDVRYTDRASPLFNSSGAVVGFSRVTNKEIQTVPLSDVRDDIDTARQKVSAAAMPPSTHLLPVPPSEDYPVEALLSRHETQWDKEIYSFKLGDFNMEILTPVSRYQYEQQRYTAELNQRMKKKGSDTAKLEPPEHKYNPVVGIWASPEMKMAFWKTWGDNMATNNQGPTTYRPKNSFGRLRLLCGDKEIEPILPGKFAIGTGGDRYAQVDKNAYYGMYTYTSESISPSCGNVSIELYSSSAQTPLVKVLDASQVDRVWKDFEPYRKMQASAKSPH